MYVCNYGRWLVYPLIAKVKIFNWECSLRVVLQLLTGYIATGISVSVDTV